MKQILIWSDNDLERQITGEILSSGLDGVQVLHADSAEQTLATLQTGEIDLFVADIPQFNLAKCNVIASAQSLAPDTPILVISSGDQEHVSRNIWRLGIREYLLKPCRPAWILAAARTLMRKGGVTAAQPEADDGRRRRYLNRLMEQLRGFQYKKCIQTTREYLDLLYDDGDNVEAIRNEVVDFAAGIADLGAPFGQAVQWKLKYIEAFNAMEQQLAEQHKCRQTLQDARIRAALQSVSEAQKSLALARENHDNFVELRNATKNLLADVRAQHSKNCDNERRSAQIERDWQAKLDARLSHLQIIAFGLPGFDEVMNAALESGTTEKK